MPLGPKCLEMLPLPVVVVDYSIVTMNLLRTPEGTGALWCTTWMSYLGVYCNGFEDGR